MGGAAYKAEIRVGDRGVLMKNWKKKLWGNGGKSRISNMIMKETDRGHRGRSSYFTKKIMVGLRGSVGL